MTAWRSQPTIMFMFGGLSLIFLACGSGGSSDGAAIDFLVCTQSEQWVRPSEEEQRQQVWSSPRHVGVDEARLRPILNESFFNWHGGNSEMFDSWPLHGLWTADDVETLQACAEGHEVFLGRLVDIYLLNYRAISVRLLNATYEVVAEPTERGFERIEFENTLYDERDLPFEFNVRVVSPDGEELYAHPLCGFGEKVIGCR